MEQTFWIRQKKKEKNLKKYNFQIYTKSQSHLKIKIPNKYIQMKLDVAKRNQNFNFPIIAYLSNLSIKVSFHMDCQKESVNFQG